MVKYEKVSLCQLGWLSCMGCCGNNFKVKEDIALGIQKNTLEFHDYIKREKTPTEFMLRHPDLRDSGICRNIIYDINKNKVFCGVHPEEHNSVDIRAQHQHCDVLHACKTAFLFNLWEKDMQNNFLKFLKTKKRKKQLDWHSYSMGMTDESLLEEFEGLNWNK